MAAETVLSFLSALDLILDWLRIERMEETRHTWNGNLDGTLVATKDVGARSFFQIPPPNSAIVTTG